MRNRRLNFWFMALAGIPAFIWLVAELIRALLEVEARSGISSAPLDGVIQHKVGELMVATPLFLLILLINKWPEERIFSLADRTRVIMIVGGLLNGLAWYSLREREAWGSFFRMWCLVLLFVGLFGSRIARWMASREKESTPGTG